MPIACQLLRLSCCAHHREKPCCWVLCTCTAHGVRQPQPLAHGAIGVAAGQRKAGAAVRCDETLGPACSTAQSHARPAWHAVASLQSLPQIGGRSLRLSCRAVHPFCRITIAAHSSSFGYSILVGIAKDIAREGVAPAVGVAVVGQQRCGAINSGVPAQKVMPTDGQDAAGA